jgi:hypothetical protein
MNLQSAMLSFLFRWQMTMRRGATEGWILFRQLGFNRWRCPSQQLEEKTVPEIY